MSGQYIIGCHPSVRLYSLPLFLPSLLSTHPELEIKFIHDLSRKITEGVVSFEIDFGIVVNPVQHPDLVIRELCLDEVTFWTSKKPSDTQTLDTKNGILICDLNLLQTQNLIRGLQKRKLNIRRVIHSSNLEVIATLTGAGVGIGVLPNRVAAHFSSLQLKLLDPRLPSFKDKICLVYRGDVQKNKGSRVIVEAIKSSVK